MEKQLRVLGTEEVATGIYRMDFECADTDGFTPGQFVHIAVKGAFLRRPFGIYALNDKGFSICYRVVGKGTGLMTGYCSGDVVGVLAPLGKGFELAKGCKRLLLIGGGMGVAPLLFAAQTFSKTVVCDVAIGFGSAKEVYAVKPLSALCEHAAITTIDGSKYDKGLVTEAAKRLIELNRPDQIMACGPLPMLRALKEVVGDIPAQVSMEERMGCGVGACLTCNCKVMAEDGWTYKRVCADGPVFELSEVVIDG